MKLIKKEHALHLAINRSQETRALLGLTNAGVPLEDYVELGWNDQMCQEVARTMRNFRLFTPPEEQIKRILAINEQVWKDATLTEQAIRELGDPPDLPVSDSGHLHCVTLLRDTVDPLKTLRENWDACAFVFGGQVSAKIGLLDHSSALILRQGAKPRPPGLKWVICELGRQCQDMKVADVYPWLEQTGYIGIGPELPFFAAIHERWALSMDGGEIPYLDAPDMEIVYENGGRRIDILCLSFDKKEGRLKLGTRGITLPLSLYGSGWFLVTDELAPPL